MAISPRNNKRSCYHRRSAQDWTSQQFIIDGRVHEALFCPEELQAADVLWEEDSYSSLLIDLTQVKDAWKKERKRKTK